MASRKHRHIWLLIRNRFFPLDTDAIISACLAARLDAYMAAWQHVASITGQSTEESASEQSSDLHDDESSADAASIADTMQRMAESAALAFLAAFTGTPDEAEIALLAYMRQWINDYSAAKSKQVGSYETGRGWETGITDAIDRIIGGGQTVVPEDYIVTVIPDFSSPDECADYAGDIFELDELDDIPEFPIHPNCPHMKILMKRADSE